MKSVKSFFTMGRITFAPRWVPTLAALVFFPLLLWLGMWQWQRAEYKQALLDHYNQQSGQGPLTLAEALKDPEGFRYFPLKAQGHYLSQHQFLQDNQFYEHQVGYYVLTPFITDTQQVILVNRGWIPKTLPLKALELPANTVTIEGRVGTMPSRTFHLGENLLSQTAWPRVIQVLKGPELSSTLGQKLEPIVFLLNPSETSGFARNWQPTGLSPEKHRGYALQWFAFATLLVVLFLVLNIKKRGKHEGRKA